MLVFSRLLGERVFIALGNPDVRPHTGIWVTVVEVHRRGRPRVVLGFQAPPHIGIYRGELLEKVFGQPPEVSERPAGCPTLLRIISYARAVTGYEETGADDTDVRAHLETCGGCRQDLRRKIP